MINFESVIDPAHQRLSRHVFDFVDGIYYLKPAVRYKILNVWSKLSNIIDIYQVLIVGGIATFNYTEYSDIDVNLICHGNDDSLGEVRAEVKRLNGVYVVNTHEINFYARLDADVDYTNFDSIYDVIENRWRRGPAKVGVDVNKYMDLFNNVVDIIDITKSELLYDIMQFEQLKHMSNGDLSNIETKLQSKLAEIDSEVLTLSRIYHKIKVARKDAFSNPDPVMLRQYERKNALPQNVIYLLLRKYCYMNFLSELNIINRKRADIPEIKLAYEKFNSCHTEVL